MAFALVVVGTMGLIAAFTVLMTQRVGSRIYPNVYINSYNVGNLTKEEAKNYFHALILDTLAPL